MGTFPGIQYLYKDFIHNSEVYVYLPVGVVRLGSVSFQCRGVLLIWIRVGQRPTAFAVGAGWACLDIFTLVYHFSFLSPPIWETARYRLKYCLKEPLSPKQPTNQPYIPDNVRLISFQ